MAIASSLPRAAVASRPRTHVDPRLIVGLLLVLASVAGTVGVVAASDRTVPVYAAAASLAPGDRVRASDLVERRVTLDGADRLYLRTSSVPGAGLVVTRPIARGELVPRSSVGSATQAGLTSYVVQVGGRVSAAVAPGASVEIWGAPVPDAAGATADPPAVLASATVVRVSADEGLVDRDAVAVEVLVPRARVARLLQAVADGDRLSLLPEDLSLGDGS